MGRLRLQQRVLSLAFLLCMLIHVNSMNVLLYFWLHDYGKVDSWHNKEIGSLPERASARDRSVFFLYSTTMRSSFKKRKPFRGHFMNAPDGLLRMQIRYFKRRQPRESRRVNNRNHDLRCFLRRHMNEHIQENMLLLFAKKTT